MAQVGKLEVQTEMKSPADKFYGFFKNNMSGLVQIFPENIKSIELVEGTDYSAGSVTVWKYVLGNPITSTVKIEAVDDENKSMTFCVLEGDTMKLYKSMKAKLEVIKEGDDVIGFVKWSLEFEKTNEEVPNPDIYIEFAAKISKVLDAYLCEI